MRKAVVAVLLAWSLGAEGVRVAPEVVADVSILLAGYYEVDCVQIFRTEDLAVSELREIHRMWKRLAVTESKVTTGVYTFRLYLEKKITRPRKVSCYRSLKIMSDDDEIRSGYATFSMRFSIRDAIWVLYTESLSVKFFEDARVVFDDVILIAEMKSEELILFHEVYKVSQGMPLKVVSLGNWTRERGLRISSRLMYDRRSDLEGVVVRFGSMQSWPATYLRDGVWQGFLIRLWKEIVSLINCTSVEVKSENLVGMKLENGSWNGLVGMATREEIDVIVAEIVIDKERSRVLDFFHPITKSRFQIYTRHLGYQWQWASVLRPLSGSVWAAAFGWLLVAALFWTFVHRACVFGGLGSMDFGKGSQLDSLFFVLQALCQQGYHHSPNSHACRVLFFVSYAVSSVLIPSYSASLVSSLAQKIHLKSFDSLQEMVADGTYRLLVKENTAQHAFLAHSKDEFFRLAYEKLVVPVPENMKKLNVRQSVMALCQLDNYAVMGVEEIVERRLQHLVNLDCPVVHLTYPVSNVYITMAAAKNNPYWGLINYHLGRLLNVGVVERLRRSEFLLGDHAVFHLKDSEPEVGMRQVVSAFLFVGVFVVLSVLLLLLEVLHARRKALEVSRRRKRRGPRSDLRKIPFRFQMRTRTRLRTHDFFLSK